MNAEIVELSDSEKSHDNNLTSETSSSKKKLLLQHLIKFFKKKIFLVLFSSTLLYLLLKDVHFNDIINSIKNANITVLILAFSLHALGLTISAIRWRLLLKSLNVESKMSYLIKSYLVATFFNHFIPSTIGGDGVRAYDSYKLGKNKAKGLAVILVDRFLGLLALLVFVIISTFYSVEISTKIPHLNILIIFAAIFASVILYLIFNPPINMLLKVSLSRNKIIGKMGSILFKVGQAFSHFNSKKKTILRALLLSFLLQANVIFYYYLISQALDFDVHIFNFSLIIPLTIFITMFPFSVNGIGIRENALFFFFSFFGILKSQAIAFAWIEFSMLLLLGLIGGLVYMLRNNKKEVRLQAQLNSTTP